MHAERCIHCMYYHVPLAYFKGFFSKVAETTPAVALTRALLLQRGGGVDTVQCNMVAAVGEALSDSEYPVALHNGTRSGSHIHALSVADRTHWDGRIRHFGGG